jgi:DNA-binding beta-propeller fold protein YncE
MKTNIEKQAVFALIIATLILGNIISSVNTQSSGYEFDFKVGSKEGYKFKGFNQPLAIAYDHNNDRIIVTDYWNDIVQVFDKNGNFLFAFGTKGSGDGEFKYPRGIAYDHNNNRIIVADEGNNRIQIFDKDGKFLFKLGKEGNREGEFNSPYAVAYDHNNNRIIVADTYNLRIQVFKSSVSLTTKTNTTTTEASTPTTTTETKTTLAFTTPPTTEIPWMLILIAVTVVGASLAVFLLRKR